MKMAEKGSASSHKSKRPTLMEIAQACNVSPSTVSKVLNNAAGDIRTNPATRLLILETAKTMGYMKHNVAMGVHLGKNTVSIIINNPANPLEQAQMVGFERYARERDVDCFFSFIEDQEEALAQAVENSLSRHVRGFALALPGGGAKTVQMLRDLHQRGIPVVLMDRHLSIPGCEFDFVESQNYEGACRMTEHLIALGHRRILFMRVGQPFSTLEERQRGIQDTLAKHRIPWPKELVVKIDDRDNIPALSVQIQSLMKSAKRPTAIFADTDHLALNLLLAFEALGIEVPRDVALVGFDDLPYQISFKMFEKYMKWELTTVRQDNIEIGYQAAKLLIDKIEGKVKSVNHVKIPVTLVIRDSCGGQAKRPVDD